jgi:hypothetical protein
MSLVTPHDGDHGLRGPHVHAGLDANLQVPACGKHDIDL